jgi:hypothetical protein
VKRTTDVIPFVNLFVLENGERELGKTSGASVATTT